MVTKEVGTWKGVKGREDPSRDKYRHLRAREVMLTVFLGPDGELAKVEHLRVPRNSCYMEGGSLATMFSGGVLHRISGTSRD